MEGAAGDGPSAFSSGAVNNEYQKGEIGSGQGGGDRLQEALFGRRLQKHIQLTLARDKSIKLGDYRVKVSVWLDEHGVIQRVQLDAPTGDDKIDQALRDSFARLPPISDMPTGIRQPVRLGIRGAGRVEVLEGLAAGDTVIVNGHVRLRDQIRVEPVRPAGQG